MNKRLIILGSGGYGRTVADVASQLNYDPIIFLDDSIPDHPLSSFTSFISDDTEFIPAFGNNAFRLEWTEMIESAGGKLATLIHPTAYVSPKATIAPGVVILPGAIINTNTTIQRGCILNIGCIVDHDVILEEAVYLAPGAIVKGENRVPALTKVDSGEVIAAKQYKI
ncbi:PglD-related sugar-binding protein [Enterococcus cecorum]|uniref:PglD N-terminal domain-containing protein n=1 Tax=Enterococcus cecorum TaxID=44008 RepID=A0A200HQ68_9ENTE|nr:hypothetical protein [Enterococcus cecorum]OUZ14856.1 hypothetical protein A5869_001961 [Enterococcus cecorum]